LKPVFDISGGFPSFGNSRTNYGNDTLTTRVYNANIISFSLGLAVAYVLKKNRIRYLNLGGKIVRECLCNFEIINEK
jgi:hypothetical protein